MPPATCLTRRISSFPADPKLRFLRLFARAMLFTSHSSRLVLSFLEPSEWRNVWDCRFGIWQAASEGGRVPTPLPGCGRSHTESLTGDLKSKFLNPPRHPTNAGWVAVSGRSRDHSSRFPAGTLPTPNPGCLSSSGVFSTLLAFCSDSSLREKPDLVSSSPLKLLCLSLSLFFFLPPTLAVSLAMFSLREINPKS